MIKFLDLKYQYESIKDEIKPAITKVIEDAAFIKGKYVAQFEENFSEYLEVKNCIGVGNGTDALEIAILGGSIEETSDEGEDVEAE